MEEGRNVFEEGNAFTLDALQHQASCYLDIPRCAMHAPNLCNCLHTPACCWSHGGHRTGLWLWSTVIACLPHAFCQKPSASAWCTSAPCLAHPRWVMWASIPACPGPSLASAAGPTSSGAAPTCNNHIYSNAACFCTEPLPCCIAGRPAVAAPAAAPGRGRSTGRVPVPDAGGHAGPGPPPEGLGSLGGCCRA